MLMNFWSDEGGALLSMEAVLLATILVIGVVVGLTSLQDAVVSELADVGAAIGSANQSYTTNQITGHGIAATAGSLFADATDFCDAGDGGTSERCVVIGGTAAAEASAGT